MGGGIMKVTILLFYSNEQNKTICAEVFMKKLRKAIALLLVELLAMGLFSSLRIEAKEIKLPVPKISVSLAKNGTDVKVTIKKTKSAEGYEVWVKGDMNYNGYKKDVQERLVGDYVKYAVIEKNGTKKRTITFKDMPEGKITVKVRAYNEKNFGTMTYSDFSKTKSVTVTKEIAGYKNSYDFSKLKKGDTFKFGAYEQDNDFENGKEPIEWLVLAKDKKSMFVVSKYAIDCLPYNIEDKDVTWETCTLRKWLNEEFYKNAFNKSEKSLIKTTTVENYDNAVYNTPGGEDTKDKVFLLSQFEMINKNYGFDEAYDKRDENRCCEPTIYAAAQENTQSIEYIMSEGNWPRMWWLRSPGFSVYNAAVMNIDGDVRVFGAGVYNAGVFVRPALVINLNP